MCRPVMAQRLITLPWVTFLVLAFLNSAHCELPFLKKQKFEAHDTLDLGPEERADARDCLAGLAWPIEKFVVQCETAKHPQYDVLVRFSSPISSQDVVSDRVAVEWYMARDENDLPIRAPAVVVVHESGRAMTVGRIFARGFRSKGLHAFMIQMPRYGERGEGRKQPSADQLFRVIRQAIADVRRARDAVAVLPYVDTNHIALQGTSLGGMVAATAASLDQGFDSVFLLLAGGQLHDMIRHGEKDVAEIRRKLEAAGLRGERLRSLVQKVEPTRIAHRWNPQQTWLFSARYDRVVPMENTLALANAGRLPEEHHIRLSANHYTGIIYLPYILQFIDQQITALVEQRKTPLVP